MQKKTAAYFYYVKEFLTSNALLFFTVFIILAVRLQVSFLNYLDFRYDKYSNINVSVVNQYKKHGKRGEYYVLKLKSKTLNFYTTSKEDLKYLLNERLNLTVITSGVSFKDYLFTFYAPGFNMKLLPVSKIDEFIEKQHKDKKIGNIFKALFLGESVDYETRRELSTLGISHLIALSGLHLGFISFFLYMIFTPVYEIFHKKFPYRNRFVDLAVVIFVIEFAYLYVTGFPPSLIRSFVLEIVVFLYAYNLRNPFSLKVLVVVFFLSLIVFGFKVFTLGYFLSVTGVFYIYLFFRYYKPNFKNSVFLSFYMFLMMFVVTHSFFGNFNIYQLFSPFINIIFGVFYPLEAVLHLFGLGNVLDGLVVKYLHLGDSFSAVKFPLWFGVSFLFLSFVSFFSKRLFYGINLLSLVIIISVTGANVV